MISRPTLQRSLRPSLVLLVAVALALTVPPAATGATAPRGDAGWGFPLTTPSGPVAQEAAQEAGRRADGDTEQTFPTATWYLPESGAPKAVVITIHGGSWFQSSGAQEATEPFALMFTRAGAAAMNIDFRSGKDSITDVKTAFDQARERYPRLPICAWGWSSGGNLALLLANRRPLACAMSEAGPTNIYTGSKAVQDGANFLFPDQWTRFSPTLQITRLRQPTVLVSARGDESVPHTQGVEFKRTFPTARLFSLDDGDAGHIHTTVDADQLKAARYYERWLVRQVGRQRIVPAG